MGTTDQTMTLEAAIEDFLAETSRHGDTTRAALRYAASRWFRAWGDADVGTIGQDRVREYLHRYREGRANSTTNQERALLGWFFGYLVKRGVIDRNPVKATALLPEETREARILTPAEVKRLLAAAGGELRGFLRLALATGLRRRTLLGMRWEWIDGRGGWLRIPARAIKARRDYAVPLTPEGMKAIKALRGKDARASGPIFGFSRSTLSRRFRSALARAGFECKFHDLRRTFFTRMREGGVPLEIAMKLSDHKDERTALRHYRAVAPEELLRAVGRRGGRT